MPVNAPLAALHERLAGFGAREAHARRILRAWTRGAPLLAGHPEPQRHFPRAVRESIDAIAAMLAGIAHVASAHPGADGSERLLVRLADGQTVESVVLPKDGLCVSTQVGCAVGCVFCMTGRDGLVRQLGADEIVAQVAAARARRPVKKVVFMGMGEPSHNLDNVMEAVRWLAVEGAIAHKNLVISTVGDPRLFARLAGLAAGDVRPALALSLHTTRAELRERLLPRAPRIAPAALVEAAEAYGRASGYPVQYQWTLLEGVNDGDDEVAGLAALLAGKYGVMNFIPYNRVEGLAFGRPSTERLLTIARTLHARGVLTTLRRSAGQDVEAGCGQLRARARATTGPDRRRATGEPA